MYPNGKVDTIPGIASAVPADGGAAVRCEGVKVSVVDIVSLWSVAPRFCLVCPTFS